MNEVIVTAYPKSGTTWLLHLVCDILEAWHQDDPEKSKFSYNHPVSGEWVVRKKHMPHWEAATPHLNGKNVIFTQRDPRDVLVSAMHYRKQDDIYAAIDQFRKSSYVDWIESWTNAPQKLVVRTVIFTRYESLHLDPVGELSHIVEILTGKCQTNDRLQEAIERQSFDNMIDQLNGDRHFMRKGVVGDWVNHFDQDAARYFNESFGEFMLKQGYIDCLDWWRDVEG